ncbi:MAG: hypothetical protein DMG17_13660 [Acidobacteria bacterium]|nr:MAG: hypothetical protein DMG17_13660 [Acidobacteriota bacterium]
MRPTQWTKWLKRSRPNLGFRRSLRRRFYQSANASGRSPASAKPLINGRAAMVTTLALIEDLPSRGKKAALVATKPI